VTWLHKIISTVSLPAIDWKPASVIRGQEHKLSWVKWWWFLKNIRIYSIIHACKYNFTNTDLLCENGFIRAISYPRGSLRFEMRWEVFSQQNITLIVYLLKINITSSHIEIKDNMFVSWLMLYINLIMCKDHKWLMMFFKTSSSFKKHL